MISSRPLLYLGLILAIGLGLRWRPAAEIRLAPDERDLGASRWLIDDPETCQHLRRIELGIANERVPDFDGFVNHPSGGEGAELPLFDTLIAGLAQNFLRSPSGEKALAYVDESDLEDLVVRASPALGLLSILCVYFAARTIARGPHRALAALVAAGVCAVHPLAVRASTAGTLDSSALAAALLALQMRCTLRALRSEALLTTILDALIAGALSGILLSATAMGLVIFLGGWVGFLWAVLRGDEARRPTFVRAGLLYCAVAAFIGRMPLTEGPWASGPNSVLSHFQSGISLLALISSAPFLVLMLLQNRAQTSGAKARPFQIACFAGALAVMAWMLPGVWGDLAPAMTWFFAHHAEIAAIVPALGTLASSGEPTLMIAATAISLVALLPCWIVLKRKPIHAADLVLLVLALATFLLSIFVRAALPLFVVVLALSIAATLDASTADAGDRARARAFLGVGAFAALLLIGSLWVSLAARDPALREERIAFVAGLRWMRNGTQAGGAWNSPRAPSDWGVLSDIADGPLVLYHARRPALSSPAAVLSGLSTLRDGSVALWKSDLSRLVRFMQGERAAYVVVGARAARSSRDQRLLSIHGGPTTLAAGEPPAHESLALAPENAAADRLAGLVLAHASTRRVGLDGHAPAQGLPSGPVISIYRLKDPFPEQPPAEMRAR